MSLKIPMSVISEESIKGPNDTSKTRVLTIGNRYTDDKMKITISSVDSPYGLWSIRFSEGKPPLPLRGQYTSYDFAKKAVERYLENHRQERRIVKEAL